MRFKSFRTITMILRGIPGFAAILRSIPGIAILAEIGSISLSESALTLILIFIVDAHALI